MRHCPRQGILKSVPPNTTETEVRWRTPIGIDKETNVTTTMNKRSGDLFPLGIHEVVYTFEDFSGNIAECTFNVTVTGKSK